MAELNKTEIPASKPEAPKAQTRQEKVAERFAKFKNATNLRSDKFFNEEATKTLNEEFSNELAAGENPSAKYLKQEIIAQKLPVGITRMLNEVIGFVEFVEAGKGVEYILTQMGTVNAMDPTAFVPTEVYNTGDHTYVDTLDLPEIGSKKTKAMERSTQLYKYIQYYLSGKSAEVANIINGYMDDSMASSIFEDLLAILERMYAVIAAKTSGEANYLEGSATNPLDAMKELKDFVEPMLFQNTSRNWGVDDGSTHEDFTKAANFVQPGDLKFLVDYRTYNSIKKVLPTLYHDDKFAQSMLGDLNNWIVVPASYLSVNKPDSGTINELPTLVENYCLFKKVEKEGEAAVRQAGTIMIIAKNGIKCAYNFEQKDSQYYPKNCVTQLFQKKNMGMKALKWCQVSVYKNAHLEDEFAIPTKSVNA